jgi:tetraacyldisaccharide-1-P 4'-kinase
MLVTTEKDWVRLAGAAGSLAQLSQRSRALPVRIEFATAEAERLAALIDLALSRR